LAARLHPDPIEKLTHVLPKPQAGFWGGGRAEKGDKRRERGGQGKGRGPQSEFCGSATMLQSTALRESIAQARPTLVL